MFSILSLSLSLILFLHGVMFTFTMARFGKASEREWRFGPTCEKDMALCFFIDMEGILSWANALEKKKVDGGCCCFQERLLRYRVL